MVLKNKYLVYLFFTVFFTSVIFSFFFGCSKPKNNKEDELLLIQSILETFISNPSNDFYTNCLIKETQPIVFKRVENYVVVQNFLNFDSKTFNEQIEASKSFSIPDSLFPKYNVVSQKKIHALSGNSSHKNASKIFRDLDCLSGLLSITKPIFNKDKTKAFFILYFKCPSICEKYAAYLLVFENNRWIVQQELKEQF